MSALATLRHVSASGRIDAWWEYDPARKVIIARLVLGSAGPIDLDEIPVCSPSHPRRLAWVLIRLSGEAWLLTAARMPQDLHDRIARAERFHPRMPVGSLQLVSAPPEVQEELELL